MRLYCKIENRCLLCDLLRLGFETEDGEIEYHENFLIYQSVYLLLRGDENTYHHYYEASRLK
jgi:hypothetical protein